MDGAMRLQNEICRVRISVDETYRIGSADNRPYDLTLNPGGFRRGDSYRTFAIEVDLASGGLCLALTGDFCSCVQDCAILEEKVLTVLQNNTVTQISVLDGAIVRWRKFDCYGTNFSIYRVEKGYVVHGEIEIAMLDFGLNKKWSFSGKDIFASVSDKASFQLCERSIKLCDFEENEYEIDYEGKLLNESLK